MSPRSRAATRGPLAAVVLTLAGLSLPAAALAQDVLELPVGDPARRDKTVALLLDGIADTADGAVLTPDEMASRLADTDILLVGEAHTAMAVHRAQLRLVRALLDAGRTVLVGLEMFPVTEQAHLDWWVRESPTEQEFVERAHWYEHWGYNWSYYRDVFLLAQQRGAPMYALNGPRDAVSAVRERGFDGLTEEERQGLAPSIDVDSDEHMRLFRAYFGDGDSAHMAMTEEQWRDMLAAQVTWDATMAWHAVRALDAHAGQDPIMVVLVGSGHVAYGLGIARQAARFFDGDVATLIPVPVEDEDGHPVSTVQASYADFIWGVPGEAAPLYPSLGVSVGSPAADAPGLPVLFVDEGAPGGAAGIRSGDRLLTLAGADLTDRETYNRLVAAARWGDVLELELARDGETVAVRVPLRRRR